ncbi:MAG: hypothetical protein LBB14_00820 [Puniceicoccales bacterium]|jgi:hypothetical protein|nr:hypothetical protein [Puniceicoccales bacterium]
MASIATVRIACDGDHFAGTVRGTDGKKVNFWRGSALRLELALFRRGIWQDLANVMELVVEIKEMGPHDRPPAADVPPLLQRRIPAAQLDLTATAADWETGSGQQAVAEFSGEETAIPAGDGWLTVWVRTNGSPPQTVAFAAGRIAVRESSAGDPLQPPEPLDRFYDKIHCDNLFLKKGGNLGDLADPAGARQNLGLGGASLLAALDEEDMASDSSVAVPTQHSAKAYVDGADGQMLQDAKDYADSADGQMLQDAKEYADSADGQALQDAKEYADSQIAAIPFPESGPENLWPGSLRPIFSSYVEKPFFTKLGTVCALDGWLISQNSVNVSPKNLFAGFDPDTIVFYRPFNSVGSGTYYMNRPFTATETEPFVNKTVTFSFELKFGAGFPRNTSGKGLALSITASTAYVEDPKIDGSGTFSEENSTIATFPEITAGSTSDYERHNFTFTLSEDVRMFCICLSHSPVGSGTAIVQDYRFYLARPTIAIGPEPAPYVPRSWATDYGNSCRRFARVGSAFTGPVAEGDVFYEHCSFPVPMEEAPICIRATDELDPIDFSEAAIEDVIDITRFGFTVARTATGDNSEAKWNSIYGFGALAWVFEDPIANY